MSGVRQKGPERPSMQSTATVSNASEQQSSPAPIYKQPVLEGKWPVSRRGFTDKGSARLLLRASCRDRGYVYLASMGTATAILIMYVLM